MSTPVSIIATTPPLLDCVTSHAAGAFIFCKYHCLL